MGAGRPGRRGAASLLAAATVLVVLGACGGEASRSAGEILSDSVTAFAHAQSFRMSGTFTQGGQAYLLDATVVRPASVEARVSYGPTTVQLIEFGQRSYVRGPGYVASVAGMQAARLSGDRWVLAAGDNLSFALARLASPAGVFESLLQGQSDLSKQGEVTVAGTQALKIGDSQFSLYVALAGRNYPLRITGTGDPTDPTAIKRFDLSFSGFDAQPPISPPSSYVDFSNPSSLPAHFVALTARISPNCEWWGCTVSVTVRNDGGAGSAWAVFRFLDSTGTEIARCKAPVRPLGYGQTRTVACWTNNPLFESYVAGNPRARFSVTVEILNP